MCLIPAQGCACLCSGVLGWAGALCGYLYKGVSHETGLKEPQEFALGPPAQSSSSVKLP